MLYVLFEAAIGYSLFEVAESEEIGIELDSVQVSNRKITFREKKHHNVCDGWVETRWLFLEPFVQFGDAMARL